ncbi:MAG: hypothetical protein GY803_09445 [Chloroflexi bacterium]|nr:hypothetical protein [Chloroflexota bacterium]
MQLPSLPRILAVFDEVQDIMAVSSGAEAFLIDLAKKGRAYGITLCCSTQLPDADAIPKGLRSQLPTRFVGLMASPRDYYAVAEVYKEHYDGVVLKPGQFFARVPGHPMWSVMQATLIPDRELERVAAAVSRGQAAPEWPRVEATTETAVRGKRPWQGSAAQKRAMVRAWLTQFDEKPSAVDFMAEFEASEPTANTWIDKVWTTVSPR